MGLWGAIKKIGKVALPVAGMVAAPFTGGMSALATGGSMFGKIAGAAGAGIGAASGAAAHNRGVNIDADIYQEQMNQGRENLRQGNDSNAISAGQLNRQQVKDYHDMMLGREQEGRAGRNDAFRGMQQAEYLANAEGYTPSNGLRSYGFGPKAATATEKTGAEAMKKEVMARLEGGNPLPTPEMPTRFEMPSSGATSRIWDSQFQIDPKFRKPSIWEKIGGFVGPGLEAYGHLSRNDDRVYSTPAGPAY